MANTYVDRGIVKWNAFDALTGYNSMLQEMKYRMNKKVKPSLSSDQLDELNYKLQTAIAENLEVEIRYYDDGYIKFTYGKITKVDYTRREILLSTYERFLAENIVEITLP